MFLLKKLFKKKNKKNVEIFDLEDFIINNNIKVLSQKFNNVKFLAEGSNNYVVANKLYSFRFSKFQISNSNEIYLNDKIKKLDKIVSNSIRPKYIIYHQKIIKKIYEYLKNKKKFKNFKHTYSIYSYINNYLKQYKNPPIMKHELIILDDFYFLKSEYMSYDLFDFIKNNPKLNYKQLFNISKQLIFSLKILRDINIIHGDIKCENILIKKYNDEYIIKLTDFDGSSINELFKVRNLTFIPPKLVFDKNIPYTYKDDLWGLGIVFIILFGLVFNNTELKRLKYIFYETIKLKDYLKLYPDMKKDKILIQYQKDINESLSKIEHFDFFKYLLQIDINLRCNIYELEVLFLDNINKFEKLYK